MWFCLIRQVLSIIFNNLNTFIHYKVSLLDALNGNFMGCLPSKTPCITRNDRLNQVEELKPSSGMDESLFENEEFIKENKMGATPEGDERLVRIIVYQKKGKKYIKYFSIS